VCAHAVHTVVSASDPDRTRVRMLCGWEALIAEDAERTVREMVEKGWAVDAAAGAYEAWVLGWLVLGIRRGADRARGDRADTRT
jgi:hypothetical protein